VTEPNDDDLPPLVYNDEVQFFTEYLSSLYARNLTGSSRVWCPRWREHREVHVRVKALWTSWEVMHSDPVGMSVWLRDHLDPHMAILLSPDNAMSGCRAPSRSLPEGQHDPDVKPLPHEYPVE